VSAVLVRHLTGDSTRECGAVTSAGASPLLVGHQHCSRGDNTALTGNRARGSSTGAGVSSGARTDARLAAAHHGLRPQRLPTRTILSLRLTVDSRDFHRDSRYKTERGET
jgi:hypothetical protein